MHPFDANAQMARIGFDRLSIRKDQILAQSSPPISSLPYELLANIMYLSLMPHDIYRPRPLRVATNLLFLCQVCSFWRSVALSTPRLWVVDTFPVVAQVAQEERRVKRYRMSSSWTDMFLERSASLPISVYIFQTERTGTGKGLDLTPKMISLVHKWKTLEIVDALAWPPQLNASALVPIPFGALKSLEKVNLNGLHPEAWQEKLDLFLAAPRLRDVSIHGAHIAPMPWAQLTRLSLSHESPQSCLDILVRCKNLVFAHISTSQWLQSNDPHTSRVAGTGFLGQLEELDIEMRIWSVNENLGGEHFGGFLQRLRLPVLKSLSLSLRLPFYDEYFVSWMAPELLSFLTRSPNLERLKIDRCDDCIFSEDVSVILQHTPNLIELEFNNSEVDDDFFTALRYTETDAAPLVPKLETLVLYDVGEDFSEESFADMIRSRWWSDDERLAMQTPPRVARLKSLALFNADMMYDCTITSFTAELKATMAVYRSQGLDFSRCGYDLNV